MGVVNPWIVCASNASQATRTVTRLHSRWMTQCEINRCDDELAFAKDYDSLKTHRNFLNRTLRFIQIRRFILFRPFWFVYRNIDRLLVKPIPDEIKYAPKHW